MSDILSAPDAPHGRLTFSVVIPVHNEEANLRPLLDRLLPVLEATGERFEVLFVDDGSRDGSLATLEALHDADPRLGVLGLSRNFGKEVALSAGLDHAEGDAVILMDGDLQHPPEVLPALIAAWREGAEVVHAAARQRPSESWARRLSARLFYWTFNRLSEVKLPQGVGDFCLLDRRAVEALRNLPERSRFMKGLYFWIGFRTAQIPYDPEDRRAGATAWKFGHLLGLAIHGLTSFSTLPLRLVSMMGLMVSMLAIVYGVVVVTRVLLFGIDVPGYASTMVGILMLGGIQLISLGIIGEYVGRIFEEIKQRPLYLVRRHRASGDRPRPGQAQQ